MPENLLYAAAQAKDVGRCSELLEDELHFVTGDDERMMNVVYSMITFSRSKDSKMTRLFIGETGVGKNMFALAMHKMSREHEKFFECTAGGQDAQVLENQLFGHARGAFTSADREVKGVLELAGSGTVFLDEIGDVSLQTQNKLLGALSNGRTYSPIGSPKVLKNEAQVIFATNRDLVQEVIDGRMREDFFRRIGIVFRVPPWKDRNPKHQERTIRSLVKKFAAMYGEEGLEIDNTGIQALLELPIGGNVREVEDLVEKAALIAFAESAKIINSKHVLQATQFGLSLELEKARLALRAAGSQPGSPVTVPASSDQQLVAPEPLPSIPTLPPNRVANEERSLDEVEKNHILATLEKTHWNKAKAASILGIERSTLDRKLKRYGIDRPDES